MAGAAAYVAGVAIEVSMPGVDVVDAAGIDVLDAASALADAAGLFWSMPGGALARVAAGVAVALGIQSRGEGSPSGFPMLRVSRWGGGGPGGAAG